MKVLYDLIEMVLSSMKNKELTREISAESTQFAFPKNLLNSVLCVLCSMKIYIKNCFKSVYSSLSLNFY